MSRINPSIARFLDELAAEFQRTLSTGQADRVAVSWDQDSRDVEVSDLAWWSCALSVDPSCRIYAGANRAAWKQIGGEKAVAEIGDPGELQASWFAPLTQSIERAAKTRFGALVSCTELGVSDDFPEEWARVSVAIDRRASAGTVRMFWVLSPELMVALGGETGAGIGVNPLELLQHLQLPVSISFGRTHMLLKDLLALANGSVVNLDREMGDKVEVRVNNCVIARGEVVAVDGNYGVRILEVTSREMTSGGMAGLGGPSVGGALRGA